MRRILFLLLIIFHSVAAIATAGHINKQTAKVSDPVLEWIPQGTTNLTVVNAPFTYYRENGQPVDPESIFEFGMIAPALYPPSADEWGNEWIDTSNVEKVACIDRGNRRTKDFECCYLIFLTQDTHQEKDLENVIQAHAKAELKVFGKTVFLLEETDCEGIKRPPMYMALMKPNLLISTTEKTLIADVMLEHSRKNTIHKNTPLWKNLDTLSSAWGIRQFSGFERELIGDSEAIGYNFSYDKSTAQLELRYFTRNGEIPSNKFKYLFDAGKEINSRMESTETSNVFFWKFAPKTTIGNCTLPMFSPLSSGFAGTIADHEEHEKQWYRMRNQPSK
jgi:hypothetical protein